MTICGSSCAIGTGVGVIKMLRTRSGMQPVKSDTSDKSNMRMSKRLVSQGLNLAIRVVTGDRQMAHRPWRRHTLGIGWHNKMSSSPLKEIFAIVP